MLNESSVIVLEPDNKKSSPQFIATQLSPVPGHWWERTSGSLHDTEGVARALEWAWINSEAHSHLRLEELEESLWIRIGSTRSRT